MCLYRHELDDPSIKSKRDTYWESICQIFNDETAHAYDNVDTGNAVVDSFTSCHCTPKFRCAFPVHKLFANYNSLKSAYETSQVRGYCDIMCVCVPSPPSPTLIGNILHLCVCVAISQLDREWAELGGRLLPQFPMPGAVACDTA